jgi:iodotyrosine deiodinase
MDTSPPMRRLDFQRLSESESESRARAFRSQLSRRRSVRHFSDAAVSIAAIEDCIAAAASGPSGANKQPWTFVLVTQPDVKRAIRLAAEEEERAFYGGRAGARWLHDLQPLGTDADKPFLEDAPALIVVFAQPVGSDKDDRHYYVHESVGIAVGFLLAGLHLSGFATLTHTPAPMGFLREILGRPPNERPFLLIPVGLPAEDCEVPDIGRKNLSDVLVRV